MTKKIIITLLITIFAIGVIVGGAQAYRMFYKNIESKNGMENYVYVYPNTTFDELVTLIEKDNDILSEQAFRFHAKLLKFSKIKSGKYQINSEESNIDLIRRFRNGEQTPVKITFNNIRTKEQLAARVSSQLMFDSIAILHLLNNNDFLSQYHFNSQTVISLFLPDTYELFWNTSAENFMKRMHREYKAFWSNSNMEKAKKMGLTPIEVATLASIVEEESNSSIEKPIIAGLYYNRLKRNMLLQSDPTVKYAVGDFGITRVLFKHLQIDSPYNTYKYAGLPPGPIRIPSKQGINAVLNMKKHNYLYMCAKETLNGEHNFAATYLQHQRNAVRYQQALNQRKIYN